MSWTLQDSAVVPYLSACRAAAQGSDFFKGFKSHPAYRHVLEHVSYEEGQQYLDEVEIDYKDKLDEIKENDALGTPVTCSYKGVGTISPTTVRYLKNTSDIVNKFGTSFDSIVEIGGGYGGLCKVMSSFVEFENYLLIDLEECNMLSRKYLSNFDLPTMSYQAEEIVDVEDNFDLLVSNYALSECNRETQMMYVERFVKKSDKFYLMHNNFHADNGNMSYEEFIDVMSDTHDIEYYGEHGVEENPKVMFGVIK
jgi:putative sugar O-methyltransferase